MNKFHNGVLAAIVCLFTHQTIAQIQYGGKPFSTYAKLENLSKEVPTETMPVFNVNALETEDLILDEHKDIPWRFGHNFNVNINMGNAGVLEQLQNGGQLWRVRIESNNAKSINFEFDEYWLPEGAKLFVYNDGKSEVLGAFTSENNKEFRKLGVTVVHGEAITIEYYEPAQVKGLGVLNIGQVTHGYRDIFTYAKGLGTSGSCNNNVICAEGDPWRDQIRSVAIIIVGGSGACTGTLINSSCEDGTPYFLTANHCLGGNVSTWIFRFNWDSPTCATTANGPTNETVSGSTLRASNAGSDFGLLELSSIPPANYNVYYAGWDRTGTAPTSSTGIHHPDGDVKKISFDTDPATATTWSGAEVWEIGNWEDGTTEPGSSGSGLFDQNGRIIGQLYGGSASCSNNSNDDYGRFNVSWDAGGSASTQLKDWLDDCGSPNTVDGYDPNNPTIALDAQISAITSPMDGLQTCDPTFDLIVTIKNKGTADLTSCTVNYSIDGGALITSSWAGTLVTNATDIINFGSQTLAAGSHTIICYTTDPNSGTDLDLTNDTATTTFTILSPTSLALPFSEGFESGTFPPADWTLVNGDGNESWEETTNVSGSGNSTTCITVGNFAYNGAGQRDEMVTPYLDFSSIASNAELTFEVAYARYSNTYHDSLIVKVSSDCGGTWTRVFADGNGSLATAGGSQTNSWEPSTSEWAVKTVNMDAFIGQSQVQVSFENYCGYGNNMFIDDINLTGVASAPTANFTVVDPTICPGTAVDYTDASTGSVTTYAWTFAGGDISTSSDANPTVVYNTPGTYSVQLDASNSVGTTSHSMNITVLDIPAISTIDNSPLCYGGTDGSATASASSGTPGYTYEWSNGVTTATATGLAAGTITISVTDSQGCNSYTAVVIADQTSVTASMSSTTATCGITDGTATAMGAGGSGNYTYTWNDTASQTTATATGIGAGVYSVSIMDSNGCQSIETVNVSNTGAPTATVTGTDLLCNGSGLGSAGVTAIGGATPYAYTWSNGMTTNAISGVSANTYSVSVMDNSGCAAVESIIITEPAVLVTAATSTDVDCFGLSTGQASVNTMGGTSGYTYDWGAAGSTMAISGLISGIYTATVTDANGCTSQASTSVNEPAELTLTLSSTSGTCGSNNGTATAVGTGGTGVIVYIWSNGQTTTTATGLGSNVWDCIADDEAGCQTSQSISVSVDNGPTATTSSSDATCNGGNDGIADVTATGGASPYTYNWSNGSTTASIGVAAGTYNCVVTDASGCTIPATAIVGEASGIAGSLGVTNASTTTSTDGQLAATVSGGTPPYAYNWNDGQTSATASNLSMGTYTLIVSDANGCTFTIEGTVDGGNFIERNGLDKIVKVWPNPTDGIIYAEMVVPEGVQIDITVVNVLGKVIMELGNANANQFTVPIDLNNYSQGIYYIQFNSGAERVVKKVTLTR